MTMNCMVTWTYQNGEPSWKKAWTGWKRVLLITAQSSNLYFNKAKCKVLGWHYPDENPVQTKKHVSREKPCWKGAPGGQQAEQESKKANRILCCIPRGVTSKDRDMLIPSSAFQAMPGIYCIQFSTPPFRKDAERLERLQRRTTKMIKQLENLPYEERLKELGIWCL